MKENLEIAGNLQRNARKLGPDKSIASLCFVAGKHALHRAINATARGGSTLDDVRNLTPEKLQETRNLGPKGINALKRAVEWLDSSNIEEDAPPGWDSIFT